MSLTKAKMGTMLSFVVFFFSFCLLFSSSAHGDDQTSVYQVLQNYNLPIGLLREGAVGYGLDPASGQFSVNLTSDGSECVVYEAGFQIKYNPTITGVISQNSLSQIDSVRVKFLFWLRIKDATRNEDSIKFKGTFWSKTFTISDFNSSPQCNTGIIS
ncbi:uncharacterized protein At5g01610-like [Rutidosis leptorrhynchoides]|uniref:uncharacterized protein At5g01610-like n=1 Tax=Rutidosis leptorrhynchoides TaxID=125765 RepID=UPI003A99298A